MSSKYEIEYVGGPMDGHREIRPSQWLMPVLTDCWNHVYYRTPERLIASDFGISQGQVSRIFRMKQRTNTILAVLPPKGPS